jgi:hypothetical protein
MNITPETIAEMASMERPMTPDQALKNIDSVCQAFSGTREEHYILRAAVRLLANIVRENHRLKSDLAALRGDEELESQVEPERGKTMEGIPPS